VLVFFQNLLLRALILPITGRAMLAEEAPGRSPRYSHRKLRGKQNILPWFSKFEGLNTKSPHRAILVYAKEPNDGCCMREEWASIVKEANVGRELQSQGLNNLPSNALHSYLV
jgi:hypothetical protein